MSDSMLKTIEELKRHLMDLEAQAIDTKKTINSLCRVIGEPSIYPDSEMSHSPIAFILKGDEYFNKPFAYAVRHILETRKTANLGPADVDEIYAALIAGGGVLEGKTEAIKKRGVSISLGKNTTTFIKLPNGKFGLAEDYGIKENKTRNGVSRRRLKLDDGPLPQTEDEAEEMAKEVENENTETNKSSKLKKPELTKAK